MLSLEKIYLAEEIANHPLTSKILQKTGFKPQILPRGESSPLPRALWEEGISLGKRILYLTRYQGRFFRRCPGTKAYLCCGYHIFHIGQGCPLDCTYCILQAYFNQPWLTFFVNVLEDGLKELQEALSRFTFLRIGTGEFTDSFALEELTSLNPHLIEFFARQENAVLELKTKTTGIDHLKDLPHRRRTILAWSLNAPSISRNEEKGAPPVEERLLAAQKAVSWGYPVAFHFDPIIRFPGWREEYAQTIEFLFEKIPPEEVCWISLGSLRFMPELKEIAWKRFPETKIFSNEFITGLDGKKRYFRPLRVELYSHLYGLIKKLAPHVCVYLCMESPEVWKEVFGFSPFSRGGLSRMLDEAAQRVCRIRSHNFRLAE